MPNSYLDTNGLKHYTDKLKQELGSGVTSFNGRTGEVSSVSGDYTVSMIPGAVPNTRTINGKSLSSNIVLNASDIGVETPDLSGYVPTTRTVNGKPLSDDITLNAEDIGVTNPDLSGYVPNTRTINGKALSSNVTLGGIDIGIYDKTGTAVNLLGSANNVSVSIGYFSRANGNSSITIGYNSSTAEKAIAMGNEAKAMGESSICIGANASVFSANGEDVGSSIAIGDRSSSSGLVTMAIGTLSNASSDCTIAIGRAAIANKSSATAIGDGATASGFSATAIGHAATASGYALAIGCNAKSTGRSSISIGEESLAQGDNSISIGNNANGLNNGYIVIGKNAEANDYGIAIGLNSNANVNKRNDVTSSCSAIAIGQNTFSLGQASISIGDNASAETHYAIAIGPLASATGHLSMAIGGGAHCTENNTIQLGSASTLSKLSCKVALSVTSDERDKTDITPIGDGAVEFLNRIKAIRYVFNGRELYIPKDENLSDVDKENRNKYGMCSYDKEAHALGTKKGERVRVGVLAQEVQKALQEVYGDKSYANLVDDNFFDLDPSTIPEGVENKLSLTYENFIPFLIKAVQELSGELKAVKEALRNA